MLHRGINRAEIGSFFEHSTSSGSCVFISHKSEDINAAKSIANHIQDAGIDVYLDIFDGGLQKATQSNDAKSVVACIERALTVSTHILVLVTGRTQESWWVPYEIGYSKNGHKQIASILLNNVFLFPDYLEIEKKLRNKKDLDLYIIEILKCSHKYGLINEQKIYNLPERDLAEYIRR